MRDIGDIMCACACVSVCVCVCVRVCVIFCAHLVDVMDSKSNAAENWGKKSYIGSSQC